MRTVLHGAELIDCHACARPFVVPARVLDVIDGGHFVIELACNDCGWTSIEVHDDRTLEELDHELEHHTAHMEAAAGLMAATAQVDWTQRFTAALAAGELLPEDF